MIPIDFILPIGMTFAFTTFSLIATIYLWPALKPKAASEALVPLLLPHGLRYLGLSFLIPGVTTEALDPRFTLPATAGDVAAAALALIAVGLLLSRSRLALPAVWIFNIWGSLDFANALTRGLLFVGPPQMGATFFIPFLIAPALMVCHGLIFAVLLWGKREAGTAPNWLATASNEAK